MSLALRDARFSSEEDSIVPFPLSGQVSVVRRCAAALENIHGDDAVLFWKTECRAVAAHLTTLGCSEEAIRAEVLNFQTEVQVEMMRRYSDRLAAQAQF